MVDVKVLGDKVEVTRALKLPKVGAFSAIDLSEKFVVKVNLLGIKSKSEVGLEILDMFQNVFEKKIAPLCKRQNNKIIESWKAAVSELESSKDEKELAKKAKIYTSKVISSWEEFNEGTAQKIAPLVMDAVVQAVSKKHNQALKKPKLSFLSKENTANRIQMEKALLAAVVLGTTVATGPVGLIAYALGAGAILLGTIEGAYKSTQKRSGRLMHSLGIIEDNLVQAEKLLAKLSSEKKRLADFRRAMNADTAHMSRLMLKLESEIKAEFANSKKNGEITNTGQVKKIRQSIVKLGNSIAVNEKAVSGNMALIQALGEAEKSVKNAASLAKADKDITNAAVDFFSSSSGDLNTGIGVVKTILGQMAKGK